MIAYFQSIYVNYSKPIYGWMLNAFFMITSIMITGFLLYRNNYPPILLFDRFGMEDGYFQTIYTKPWTRISSYCVGIFLYGFWCKFGNVKIGKVRRLIEKLIIYHYYNFVLLL